ncbi:MAG: PIN domain nuclease [Thermodesulfobacteriota bacterium]
MILVDSSVWIAYYRPEGSEGLKNVIKEAISSDLVSVNGIIIVEVLSGISKKGEFKKVRSDFRGFHLISLSNESFFEVSSLGSSLRRKGVTVPSTDLIIAASAVRTRSTLYHLDSHFDLMAEHTPLEVRNLINL